MADTTTRIYELQVKLAAESLRNLQKLQQSTGSIEKQFASASAAMKNFGAGLAGSLTFGAFVSAISGAITAMDDMGAAAERLGLSSDVFQGLVYGAEQADVSISELETGIKFLQKAIVEATDKTSKSGKLFAAIGVDPTGKSTEEVLLETADALQTIGDESVRTAAQLELFGKSGTALTQWLNTGSAGIEAMTQRAKELGIVVSTETLNAVSTFDNTMKDVQATTGSMVKTLTAGMLPAMQDVAGAFVESGKDANAWITLGETLGVVIRGLAVAVSQTAFVFKGMGTEIGGIAAQISRLMQGDFAGASAIREAMVNDANEARAAQDKLVDSLLGVSTATTSSTAATTGNTKATKDNTNAARDAMAAKNKQADAEKRLREELAWSQAEMEHANKTEASFAKEREELFAKGRDYFEATRSPMELLNREMENLQRLLDMGAISWDTYGRAIFAAQDKAEKAGSETKVTVEGLDKMMAELADKADGYAQSMAGAMVDFALNSEDAGEAFSRMATQILSDMAKMAAQILIMEPIMKEFKGWLTGSASSSSSGGFLSGIGDFFKNLFADGAVIKSPSLSAYSNGIYTSPKMFAFADGGIPSAGVFAEAGAEAIMPVSRGPDGTLGVDASGVSNGDVTVNVYNESKAEVSTNTRTNADGSRVVELMVKDAVSRGFMNGSFDSVMAATFGLNRRGAF